MRSATSVAGVLALGAFAAVAAGLGPPLLDASKHRSSHVIGFADALAAGMMLGIGYSLMNWGIIRAPIAATIGAAVGVGVMFLAHVRLGIGDPTAELRGRRALIASMAHATPEGVALGAAAALGQMVAVVVAATLAIHNISESAVLASHLSPRSRVGTRGSLVAVESNLPQVVFGVVAFVLARWRPSLVGPLLGFSFGSLVYLCFAELIPDSYRTAGRSSIAVVVTVAAGVVALVSGAV
ncbi:MAG: hypothetical protein ABI442_21690 [Gemmatimonadaceae bacterium]